MKLNSLFQELRFDKRMTEWCARYNMTTYKEYQKHLSDLPDLSDQADKMTGLTETKKNEVSRSEK